MKRVFIVFLVLLLTLTLFVACDNDKQDVEPAVQMKPFASPDPNNPYDEKVVRGYTAADIGKAEWIYIVLTQSETFNNIFYDYKLEDFFDDKILDKLPSGTRLCDESPLRVNYVRSQFDDGDSSKYSNVIPVVLETYVRVLRLELGLIIVDKKYDEEQEIELNLEIVELLNEKDYISKAYPYYGMGWFTGTPSGYYSGDQDALERINVRDAWDYTMGSDTVLIGNIDSGIDDSHPGFTGRIDTTLSSDFDTHQNDKYTNNNNVYTQNYNSDTIGHGTETSAIIMSNGLLGNYSPKVFGVATLNVKIAMLKVVEDNSTVENVEYLIDAIEFAEDNDIKILNYCSGFKRSTITDTQYNRLESAINSYSGILIVAAGNVSPNSNKDNLDTLNASDKLYPQCFTMSNIIVVAASNTITNNNNEIVDVKAEFHDAYNNVVGKSCYGEISVDLFAPGDRVLTAQSTQAPSYNLNPYLYTRDSGTSMAAPFVTGVAALIASYYPNISTAELKARILYAVDDADDDVTAFSDKCVTGGRLNAVKAFHNHQYQYIDWTDLKHKAVCTLCGYERNIAHSIEYENLGISIGHRQICGDCNHLFGSDPHFWIKEYILGTPHGYSCKQCRVWTQYIDVPFPGFDKGVKRQLEGMEIGENGIGVLPVSEHVAIIYDNGKYGIIVECDEQGRPLEKISKEIFAEDFDVDALQKELDKKTENLLAIQEEQKKTLKELFDEDE